MGGTAVIHDVADQYHLEQEEAEQQRNWHNRQEARNYLHHAVENYGDEVETQNNSEEHGENNGSDQKPSRDQNRVRYTSAYHEFDQEKVTGDFDRANDTETEQSQQCHSYSYVDTYDPNYRDEMYTNTTEHFPETIEHNESDYYIQSGETPVADGNVYIAQQQ